MADIAFGAPGNSHGETAVALNMPISFFTTAMLAGSRLVAEAREIKQGRRAGFYQVSVTSEERGVGSAGPLRRPSGGGLKAPSPEWLT